MGKNVTEWLDITAEKFPNKVAVSDEMEELTFGMLRKKAQIIAEVIEKNQIGTRKPIAVCIERGVKAITAFMGVAYSGNFYSPIDVNMPESRIEKILSILEPGLIVTTEKARRKIEACNYSGSYIIYEEISNYEIDEEKISFVQNQMLDIDILCVLFTSGSTGIPKGVCITHRSIMDYIEFEKEIIQTTEIDNRGNQVPFQYVISMFDIYNMIRTGNTLFIIPERLFFQPILLLEFLKEKKINTIFCVPSFMMILSKVKAFEYVDVSECLKKILFAGEVMSGKQLKIWQRFLPNARYFQLYGCTEVMPPLYHIITSDFDEKKPIPIGRARKNVDVFLLDENNQIINRDNLIGELCVRGASLSAGYYNDMVKTSKVFIQNPVNHVYEERIFRTGDLARYDENGELIYVARKDFQIKHKGHRIELGEIETAIVSIENINECVCMYNSEVKEIVAFVDVDISKNTMNSELKKILPKHMLPSKVIALEHFPLNENGKIDRGELSKYMRGNI